MQTLAWGAHAYSLLLVNGAPRSEGPSAGADGEAGANGIAGPARVPENNLFEYRLVKPAALGCNTRCALYRLYLGIADGMSIARAWACRYSK